MLLETVKADLSVSMTTRRSRPGEIEGESYYFVTEPQFKKMLDEDGLLEHAEVYGNFYGTPKAPVLEKLDAGRDVILEIDIQGALKVKEKYPACVCIFILPPSMRELRKRITTRGSESDEAIDLRMNETLREISYIDKYDYCVVNGVLEEAVNRVSAIMTAEHSKVGVDIETLMERYRQEGAKE